MKVTVCELKCDPLVPGEWEDLVCHVRDSGSEAVLLPEMSFSPWFPADPDADPSVWRKAVESHDEWMERLRDLAPATVLGTRPIGTRDRRTNQAFVWDQMTGYRGVHEKTYLPNEEGFWEANWYHRGEVRFEPVKTGPVRIGFQICSEIWFFQHSRQYSKAGIHILANPRATGFGTREKWLTGGRVAGIVSGAFCLSSNRAHPGGCPDLGGFGWITGPDGEVLGTTSEDRPFLTLDIDPDRADAAKKTYPRYVID